MQNFKRLDIEDIIERLTPVYGDKAFNEAHAVLDVILNDSGHHHIQSQALENFLTRLERAGKTPSEAIKIESCYQKTYATDVPDYDCLRRREIWKKFPGIEYSWDDLRRCQRALDLLVSEHKGMDHAHDRYKGTLARTFKLDAQRIVNQDLGRGWRQKSPEIAERIERGIKTAMADAFRKLNIQTETSRYTGRNFSETALADFSQRHFF
ncbi:MAG: hypothetical protein DI551_03195 [Micavibrio aeruginosavorus]|uniref:Uncharacterized protein n=1 Tax=Micavibrio aeruginosavorus TaxID=349221 RepID=A0A2W5N9N5_9BACT|nr:MAG: hypothetical protein DI551_03195 [Micavibrio aeruginosavorus]